MTIAIKPTFPETASDPGKLASEILSCLTYRIGKEPTVATQYDWLSATIKVVRDRLIELAAARMDVEATDVKITPDGLVSAKETVGIPDLLHGHFGARGTTLTTEADFTTSWQPYDKETGRSPQVTEHWFAGAAAVRLTVDTFTGRVRIEHLAVAGDVGRAINPTMVEQQLTGAAIMGIGHALFDELTRENLTALSEDDVRGVLDRGGSYRSDEFKKAALRRVEEEILRDHVAHCVEHAIVSGDKADQRRKIAELMDVVGRADRA